MVTNLSVARGDRVKPASRSSRLRARASFRFNATTCKPSRRTCLPPSSSNGTPNCSKARPCRYAFWRPARPKPGRQASRWRNGGKCFGSAVSPTRRSRRLTSETAITATLSVVAPQPATVVEIVVSPGPAGGSVGAARQARTIVDRCGSRLRFRHRASAPFGRARKWKSTATRPRARSCWFRKPPMRRPKPSWCAPKCRIPANCAPGKPPRCGSAFFPPVKAPGRSPTARLSGAANTASVFVAIEGGFRLVPVTLLAEDQDHVVVSGAITDKDEVAVSGISALRGILLRLGAGE